jgi:guanosine-diphosphatase
MTQGSLAQKITSSPKAILLIATVLLIVAWPRDSGSSSGSKSTGSSPSGPDGCPSIGTRYGIMMDAGSTGSRTHVFEFKFHADGRKELVREVFEQLKPGLSSFADDPAAAAKSLKPLMEVAVREVPVALRKCTPIALKATAGLRLIGHEKSEAILNAVETMMKSYPFLVAPTGAAVVMDGKDEGPYAWITVNFLLGALDGNKKTSAIFDMGGGSTQVVFIPDDVSILSRDEAPPQQVFNLNILGKAFKLYTHSYLGLGLKEAGKAIKALAKAGPDSPCLPEKEGGEAADHLSFDKCLPFAEKILGKSDKCDYKSCAMKGIYQPKLSSTFSGDLFVFSYFYDRMEPFLDADGRSTVGAFKEIGKKICANEGDQYKVHNKGTMCMDFTFLYAILSKGYELPDTAPVLIKKKINDVETAWPLGAMLVAMS